MYNPEKFDYYEDGDLFTKKSDTKITEKGIKIEAGKTYNKTYMVETNKNSEEEKNIETTVNISKNEYNIHSLKYTNKLCTSNLKADIRPLYRNEDEELEDGKNYKYKITIQNLSNKEQKDVKVKLEKNNALEINRIGWYVKEEADGEIISQDSVEPEENVFVIDYIPANKSAEIIINANGIQNSTDMVYTKLSAKVEDSTGNTYRTNILQEKVTGVKIEATIEQEISPSSSNNFVKAGNQIKYMIKMKNIGSIDAESIEIQDEFSHYLNILSVKVNGKDSEYNTDTMIGDEYNYDIINVETQVKAKEEVTLEILGQVDGVLPVGKTLEVINKAIIFNNGKQVAETEELVNYLEEIKDEENNNDNNNDNDDNTDNNKDNQDENNETNKFRISGTAWLDENENGKRDDEEQLLKEINVILLNLDSNVTINTKTQEDGKYTFENVEKGRYVVIFEYDNGKYVLTTYNAKGVNTTKNSDVENVNMTIDGTNRKVAATDTLIIEENSLLNIDIGLKEAKVFDLELSKTISRVTITNKSGTKTNQYNDVNLAKAEIRAKYLSGSVVLIEYKIKVTNNGDVAGYARKIVDYKPNDLEFNSEVNSKWYKSGDNLYSNSLSDIKINPGETKELTLVLTKKMTNSNTGLTNNKAEIAEAFNASGISDIDSEDNIGQADAIISVGTGKAISFAIIAITISIIIGMIVYFNLKRIVSEKIKF